MDPFFDPMVRTINRNLLKYSAGQAIFCPLCGCVADCRHWVVASAGDRTLSVCAHCFDKHTAGKDLSRVDVVDGRVIFARPRRKETPAQEMRRIAKLPKSYVEGP
jgi:uncharacterized Zn finger protein